MSKAGVMAIAALVFISSAVEASDKGDRLKEDLYELAGRVVEHLRWMERESGRSEEWSAKVDTFIALTRKRRLTDAELEAALVACSDFEHEAETASRHMHGLVSALTQILEKKTTLERMGEYDPEGMPPNFAKVTPEYVARARTRRDTMDERAAGVFDGCSEIRVAARGVKSRRSHNE